MKFHWLLVMVAISIVMFAANGDDLLNTDETTGNNKVVELECGDFFEYPTLTAWDACDGEITSDIIMGGDEVVPELVGEYVITYNVFDAAGNPAEEATRTVQVIDTDAPIITLFGDNPSLVAAGEAWFDKGANAFDACDGDLSARLVVKNPVDVYAIGHYTVTYNVEDGAGNAAVEAQRLVHVVDDMPDVGSLSDIFLEEGMFYEWDGQVKNEAHVNGFQWYRNNGRHFEAVVDGPFSLGAYIGAATSALQFAPFTAAMAGEYMLEISGNKSTVQRSATVTIEKDPGVPAASALGLIAIALTTAVTGVAALKKRRS